MKALKILLIVAVVYVGIVVLFESLLGYAQPENDGTLVISITDNAGESNDRVLSRLELDGTTYVAVNHWPRAWYNNALERPDVKVNYNGTTSDHVAVPVSDAEHARLQSTHPVPVAMRFLMGFAPRHFLRLDPRG